MSQPAPAPESAAGNSYWSIVGRQLRKNRPAMVALYCLLGLLVLAIFAPLLASDRPFFYSGPEGTFWPWFSGLYDRIAVKQPVDLFFNLLMPATVLFVPAFVILRRALRRSWSARVARGTLAGFGLIFLWFFGGIYFPDSVVEHPAGKVLLSPGLLLRKSKPLVDWHERIAEARKNGQEVRAIFPPLPYSYGSTRGKETQLAPSLQKREDLGGVGSHPLGTDVGGRDVLTTLLYGTRISMTIGVIAVAIAMTIGITLGSLAGYFGGWVDILISRFIEIMICFPTLFFILTIVSVFETRTIFLIMAAIGFTTWTGIARLVRGEFFTQRNIEYVLAAEALGVPRLRIVFRHVLPNALTPVLVSATFGVASAILTESGIAFLGLGDVNAASWGMLLNYGRQTNLEWLILAPGAAIFATVWLFNLLGEGVRDALDPKLRK